MQDNEAKNLIGCCGLYCGLCSKYQSKAPGRCIGCKFGEQHLWCSIWNCCVKNNEGRSMSFYCKACARMSIELINEAVKEAKKRIISEKVDKSDVKSKAKILKSIIKDIALASNVNMD